MIPKARVRNAKLLVLSCLAVTALGALIGYIWVVTVALDSVK